MSEWVAGAGLVFCAAAILTATVTALIAALRR
jgi:hypothetical protein